MFEKSSLMSPSAYLKQPVVQILCMPSSLSFEHLPPEISQLPNHIPTPTPTMDILAALESMADLSFNSPAVYISTNIERCRKLFGFAREQAEREMEEHLNNLSRQIVSDEQWALVSGTAETENHDQESYAYYLSRLAKLKKKSPAATAKAQGGKRKQYLLKL
jgi:dTDP-D-glucose 4,6-dehydratase